MAKTSGRKHRHIAARVAAAAITAALVGTGTSAVAADSPSPVAPSAVNSAQQPAAAAAAVTVSSALYGIDKAGNSYGYTQDQKGGFLARKSNSKDNWSDVKDLAQVNNNTDDQTDGLWARDYYGHLMYLPWESAASQVGSGWNIYNKIVSAGNFGGAGAGDLLARDSSGVLYLYLGTGNGKLTTRYKVGSGWNTYNQIAGNGDLTGDGKHDLVAQDKSGVLWLYKGTGNYKAPFGARTKVGAGWNAYNVLISTGDLDYDGRADLLARDKDGVLWRYSGTGNAASPYKARVKIGGGWSTYRLLY
ncbi:FG-GAP repeat domain-containing protein [Streptomyces sp. NBC_00385]|uniref:FG-GAP repeat domain-containing protein n=1 Tax=Streptomyces sp. NBC_00385 TaxID=2975733 RepID=UPI002DD9E9CF|nr:VCBS repeat-containing protein [Streptomyces sp. NBC_00385]WRZ03010.1 VCBS repeat-containing protein [Streptomyces sp. NBC_00385]